MRDSVFVRLNRLFIIVNCFLFALCCFTYNLPNLLILPNRATKFGFGKIRFEYANSRIFSSVRKFGCNIARRNILLLPWSLDTISRPYLQCTISTPQGAFLAKLPINHGVTGKYILNISFASYWVRIYAPGSRVAMWINCLAEGQKCRAIAGIEPGLSA